MNDNDYKVLPGAKISSTRSHISNERQATFPDGSSTRSNAFSDCFEETSVKSENSTVSRGLGKKVCVCVCVGVCVLYIFFQPP